MIIMDARKLINWAELSRILCGSRHTMRRNNIPKKHEPVVDKLEKAIESVFEKETV